MGDPKGCPQFYACRRDGSFPRRGVLGYGTDCWAVFCSSLFHFLDLIWKFACHQTPTPGTTTVHFVDNFLFVTICTRNSYKKNEFTPGNGPTRVDGEDLSRAWHVEPVMAHNLKAGTSSKLSDIRTVEKYPVSFVSHTALVRPTG